MEDRILAGCYTAEGDGAGIYLFGIDRQSGKLTRRAELSGCVNPSYLAVEGSRVYAVNELPEEASLTAMEMEAEDRLRIINTIKIPGAGACHISLHQKSRLLFAADYMSGDAVSCRIGEDGGIAALCGHVSHASEGGPEPHCHCVAVFPDGEKLVAADLGTDKLYVYHLDRESGVLEGPSQIIPIPAGEGARHFVFHPGGRFGYLVTESGNRVLAFMIGEKGKLREMQTLCLLPEGYGGTSYAAAIKFSPDSRRLYVSNRGYDHISVFSVDRNTGMLQSAGWYPCGGKWPRDFCISPDGSMMVVANQKSGCLVCFRLNSATGAICEMLDEVPLPGPACVIWHSERSFI